MPESLTCPRCGATLPADGQCLACLLQLGLDPAQTAANAAETALSGAHALPPAEKPGDRIGRYKLLQQIGEGGCGVVYMAEQDEPVRRRVALKIIKLGMDTRQVIARFEAERQALAMMDHPNIAKVFDAGATEGTVAAGILPAVEPGFQPGGLQGGERREVGSPSAVPGGKMPPSTAGRMPAATLAAGRPYFVMELVRGVKITTYCDQQKLSTRERLALFIQVCQAIQHAHQKGIIHRDIKPSNILVTEQDGAPMPKIIDFGIAKATTDQRLTDKTVFTAFEQFIGTPAYMSPEQAGLGGLDIDTRSDIYSLGVLLYELLTGQPPFNAEKLAHSALDEILRVIRETEPPRPSSRLTTLSQQELTTVAQRRQTESAKLPGLLRGDLDWIVMKALDKDRRRRYETANGLARDLERYLHNEPVVARPPSNVYRLQRFARRNKLVFAAGTSVILALSVGLGISTWSLLNERQARRRAATAAADATTQARIAEVQRGVADGMRRESQQLADRLKSTLTRADFIAGSEQLEAGKVSRGLSFLARSMRTDPTFAPAAIQTIQALTERSLQLQPPVRLEQDKPIQSWAMNETKDVIWTIDIENRGFLWNVVTGQKIAPMAEGKQVQRVQFTRDGKFVFASMPEDGAVRGWDAHTGAPATPVMKPGYGFADYFVSAPTNNSYRLVIQNGDGSLQIWEASRGAPVSARLKTAGKVVRFGFSPDGSLVYGDFDDRTLVLWKASTGEPFVEPIRHDLTVSASKFSPDSRFLVLSSQAARLIQWWDVSAVGAPSRKVQLEHPIRDFKFNRPGDQMVITTWDDARETVDLHLPVISLVTGQELRRTREPKLTNPPGLQWAGWDRERSVLDFWIAGGVVDQRTFRVWDLHTGKIMTELPLQESRIVGAEFSPEGGRVALVLENNQFRVWDLFTAKPLADPIESKNFQELLFSPDGEKLFLTVNSQGTWVHVYDTRTGRLLIEPFKLADAFLNDTTPTGDRARMAAHGIVFTRLADGRTLQTTGWISLWRSEPGPAFDTQLTVPDNLQHAEFSPDGRWLVAVNAAGLNYPSDPSYAFVWDTATRKLITKLKHPASIAYATFSPDGRQIVTAGVDRVARLWDLETGQLLKKFPQDFYVRWTHFSPDGRRILSVTGDGKVQVWDVQTGFPLFDPVKVASVIYNANFSPDGSRFVVAPLDKSIRVFETSTGKETLSPLVLEATASWAGFSPDGEAIFGAISGVASGINPRVWNAQTGELLREIPLGIFYHTAAFHPKANILATGSGSRPEENGAVHLWNWKEGRLALEPLIIPGQARYVRFNPSGSMVAALSNTGWLRVWDVGTGRSLLERSHPSLTGTALAFSPDDKQLMVGYSDGTLDLLDLPSAGERAPEWLGDLAESVAASRLNADGALEAVYPEKLKSLRKSLSDSKAADEATRWAKWFLADRPTRAISPGAELTVGEYALKLVQASEPLTNRFKALQLAPNNGQLYARLGLDLASSSDRTNVVAHATNQWNAMVQWYINQATNLAPDSAEVWALRACTLFTIGRETESSAAAERAMNLDSRNPNVWYAKAMSLAARGAKEESYSAFVKAFDLLPRRTSDIQWENQLLKPFLVGALQYWLDRERQNPIEMARLGRERLLGTVSTERHNWEARWLTRRATELAPDDPEVWRLRAVVLLGADEEEESLAAIKRAIDVDEQGNLDPRQFGAYLRERSELLDKAGRSEESRAFVLRRGIPPRPANATSLQVDLSRYYNVALREDLHRSKGATSSPGTWCEKLPNGLVKLAGVEFDVRGHVHLNGQSLAQGLGSSTGGWAVNYPGQIRGIPVNQKAQWLHFMHGSTWTSDKSGTIIGRYRVHYVDGQTHDFPIALGRDVQEWWASSGSTTTHSQVAWRERSGGVYKTFFASTWENPRPEVQIRELDLISDMTLTAPSVVAVTLENPKEDKELTQMTPAALAEEAMAKLTRPQGLAAAGKAYADKLSQLALSKVPEEGSIRYSRAEMLVRIGQLSGAKTLIDALLNADANDAEAWHLRGSLLAETGQRDESIAACQKSIELVSSASEAVKERRKKYVQTAVDILSAEGRMGDARRFFVRASIPQRDSKATPAQVNLGEDYNCAFSEAWFQRPDIAPMPPVLRTFPAGLATFQGVVFDARGVVQLNDRSRRFVHEFPNEVTGIRVGAKGHQVHFIHAFSYSVRFGTLVARYRMRYANGEVRLFDISADRDIGDIYLNLQSASPEADLNVVWKAEKVTDNLGDVGLFLSTWNNPLPDIEITSIDLVSALSEAQPFVVAITVERFKTDAELAALPPRQLAELAYHKVNPKVRPGNPAVEYATRLSQKALELGANDPEVRRWRAEMLHRLGEEEPALAEVQESLELSSDSVEARRLKVVLLSKLKKYDAVPAAQTELRRHELKERIPLRDPNARPNLVDLSAHYTAALSEEPHWTLDLPLPTFSRLSQLPRGIQNFCGIEFDVRGFVQLNGAQLELRASRLTIPREVNHIRVEQRGRKLHFLHGTGWSDPDGTVIGRYIIHFANGDQRQVPMILGADVYDWVLSKARRNHPAGSASKLGWRGRNPNGPDHDVGVYVKTWDNPLPDVEISHIDFVSEMRDAAPFLVALTVE